jgi:lysophospholipase L1-like esterase
MRDRARPKTKLLWITYVAILILAGTAILEGGLRWFIHVRHGVPGKTYGLWRDDDVLGAQHQENAYNTRAQTNDYGFRNVEDVIDPKPEGAMRVIAYGGSTTFCYNLADTETWPAKLEQLLRSTRHPADQVLNAGAITWSIGHAFARAQKDIPMLRPDLVIIQSGMNEIHNAVQLAAQGADLSVLVRRGEYGAFATNLDQNRWLKRNVLLVRLFDYKVLPQLYRWSLVPRRAVGGVLPEHYDQPGDPTIEQNYLEVLRRFVALVRAYGGVPVFFIQSHDGRYAGNEIRVAYSKAGANVARELGATVIDGGRLLDEYPGPVTDLFYQSGYHFSALGAERAAELLYRTVVTSASDSHTRF